MAAIALSVLSTSVARSTLTAVDEAWALREASPHVHAGTPRVHRTCFGRIRFSSPSSFLLLPDAGSTTEVALAAATPATHTLPFAVGQVASGVDSVLFLSACGRRLAGWGRNVHGQLGTPVTRGLTTEFPSSSSPPSRRVPCTRTMGLGATYLPVPVEMISPLRDEQGDGRGDGQDDRLGDGRGDGQVEVHRTAVADRLVQVCVGSKHALARTAAGALWVCGAHEAGILGIGPARASSSPSSSFSSSSDSHTPISSSFDTSARGASTDVMDACTLSPPEPAADAVPQAAAGAHVAWTRLRWCTRTISGAPSPARLPPIVHVACGVSHSIALSRRGHAFTWGRGAFGALGHGDTATRVWPTRIELFAGLELAVTDAACGLWHTAVVVGPAGVDENSADPDPAGGWEEDAGDDEVGEEEEEEGENEEDEEEAERAPAKRRHRNPVTDPRTAWLPRPRDTPAQEGGDYRSPPTMAAQVPLSLGGDVYTFGLDSQGQLGLSSPTRASFSSSSTLSPELVERVHGSVLSVLAGVAHTQVLVVGHTPERHPCVVTSAVTSASAVALTPAVAPTVTDGRASLNVIAWGTPRDPTVETYLAPWPAAFALAEPHDPREHYSSHEPSITPSTRALSSSSLAPSPGPGDLLARYGSVLRALTNTRLPRVSLPE